MSEISQLTLDLAKPAARATAVVAVSGGMVATMTIPAQAMPGSPDDGSRLGLLTDAGVAEIALGPSVSAPAQAAPASSFGALGFTTKVVSVPAARTARVTTAASRSTTRTAPAAAVNPIAGGSIVATAQSMLGIPYRYGGMSLSGTDCSGFTSMVFRYALGITLPRTASGQQASATRVSNPVPGDLVFFGHPAYHVGIYIGNGMMIDSAHTGTVTAVRKIWTSVGVSYGRVA